MKRLYKYIELSNIASSIKSLYDQGLPMLIIFELLDDLPISKSYKISLKNIRSDISKGKSLEESFKKHSNLYPLFFIQSIAIGEKCGKISEVLYQLEKIYSKIDFILKKIASSLIYPIVIITSLIILLTLLILFAIPIFYKILKDLNAEVPLICNILNNISIYVKDNPLTVIIGIVFYLILTPILFLRLIKKDKLIEYITNIKSIKMYFEYNCLLYLTLIFKSGIPLTLGLETCINSTESKILRNIFMKIFDDVSKGDTFYSAVKKTNIFSKYSMVLIKIGEESGSLEYRLEFACKYIEESGLNYLDGKLKLIQPISILVIGGVIMFFISTIVLPLFSGLYGGI